LQFNKRNDDDDDDDERLDECKQFLVSRFSLDENDDAQNRS